MQVNEEKAIDNPKTIRVLSWNIQHGQGLNGRIDLEGIAEFIRNLNPDIVFLTEVDVNWSRSGYANQPQILQELTGLTYGLYQPNLILPSVRGQCLYGNLLLSRYPIIDQVQHRLPRHGVNEPRGLIQANVAIGNSTLTILGTHLSLAPQERLAQIEYIVDLLPTSPNPLLVVGDLNATPDTQEIRALVNRGLTNTLRIFNPVANTFPSHRPDRQIDYILADSAMQARLLTVNTINTTLSDHDPVIAEFSLAL